MDSGQPLLGTNNGELRIEYQNGRLLVNKAGTDIMLAGSDLEGDVIVKIAKPGIDVKTATDDELVFNSGQNVFKIVKIVNLTIPTVSVPDGGAGVWNNASSSVQVSHGLGYTPVILAYVPAGTTYSPLPITNMSNPSNSSAVWITTSVAVDDNNVYGKYDALSLHSTVNFGSTTVKCYLLQETSN